MTVEATLFSTLGALVGGRAFPDVAPNGTAGPFITYQQSGGDVVVFLEAGMPSKRNGRFQINTWATTRLAAADMSRQVEAALVTSGTLRAEPMGAPTAIYEPDTLLYGARQFFSIWFDV